MEILLIRHAVAVPADGELADEARPLTAKGKQRFARAVTGLRHLGVKLDRVYHSPWLRAVETAELLVPLLDGETVVSGRLAAPPGKGLLAELGGDRIALVGHEPWMGELRAWLTLGQTKAAAGFDLRKGGVAWVEGEAVRPGAMKLVAFLPPRILRSL